MRAARRGASWLVFADGASLSVPFRHQPRAVRRLPQPEQPVMYSVLKKKKTTCIFCRGAISAWSDDGHEWPARAPPATRRSSPFLRVVIICCFSFPEHWRTEMFPPRLLPSCRACLPLPALPHDASRAFGLLCCCSHFSFPFR